MLARTPRNLGVSAIQLACHTSVACLLSTAAWATSADLTGDGIVDAADQTVLLASWGDCPAPCPADLNGDGIVDGADYAILLDAAMTESSSETTESGDSIDTEGLYVEGDGTDSIVVDDETSLLEPVDPVLTDDELKIVIHTVPLPAPVWIGIAGLAGAAMIRRRVLGRFA